MGDFARHEELERVLGAGVAAEIDQPLIDDFRPRLRGDVAAQVDVELAGDLEVVGGPGIPHGIVEVDTATAGDRDKGIDFGLFSHRFQRLEVHAGQCPDDFQMAQFFRPNVHQQVFAARIVAIEALDRILHRRR